ncbi:hypothetical protein ACA910_014925 [Epithemia clementina (nom. ined.)]
MADQVLRTNEKAIYLIRSMDYNAAAALLSECMAVIEHEHQKCDKHGCDDYTLGCETCTDLQSVNFEEMSNSSFPSIKGDVFIGDNVNPFVMYGNALTIPQDVASSSREDDYHFVCSILLYNYGLSLHLYGLAYGSEEHLEDALLSYEMSLGLVGLAGRRPLVHMVELALLNNCGHIHSFFMATSQVHICLERMQTLLQSLTNGWSQVLPEALASFAFNLVYNAPQYARPAPAA